MDEKDASIYVLGLKNGILTTRDVMEEIPELRQSTAGDRLRRLADRGFFEQTLSGGQARGGRGRARMFRVVYPGIALRDLLEGFKALRTNLARIDEHLELLGEVQESQDEDVWMIKPQSTAISLVATSIESARNSLRSFSHDCTWFESEEILESLDHAKKKGVEIEMIATNPSNKAAHGIKKKLGIDVRPTDITAPAFLIVDEQALIMPIKSSGLSSRYYALRVANRYLLKDFLALFELAIGQEE